MSAVNSIQVMELYTRIFRSIEKRSIMSSFIRPLLDYSMNENQISPSILGTAVGSGKYSLNGKIYNESGYMRQVLKKILAPYREIKVDDIYYFSKAASCMHVGDYGLLKNNMFLNNIKLPIGEYGDISISMYNNVRGSIVVSELGDYDEVIGYYMPYIHIWLKDFSFPVLFNNDKLVSGVFLTNIKLTEAEFDKATGNVLIYGLNMGYYPYIISNKEDVKSITIVEESSDIIMLFLNYILPQFKYKDKVNVIHECFDRHYPTVEDGEYDVIYTELYTRLEDIGDFIGIKVAMHKFNKTKVIMYGEDYMKKALINIVFGACVIDMKHKYGFEVFNDYIDDFMFYISTLDYVDDLLDYVNELMARENLSSIFDLDRLLNLDYSYNNIVNIGVLKLYE